MRQMFYKKTPKQTGVAESVSLDMLLKLKAFVMKNKEFYKQILMTLPPLISL